MKRIWTAFLILAANLAAAQTFTITGTGCTNPIDVTAKGGVGISVTTPSGGTSWTGAIQAKVSINGDAAQNVSVVGFNSPAMLSTITASGDYVAFVAGSTQFQVCGNTVTNTAQINLYPAPLMPYMSPGNTDANGNLVTARRNTVGTDDPCALSSVIPTSKSFSISTATSTLIVPISGTKNTYICSWDATIQGSATTVGTLQWEWGTQATNPCDTGTTVLTGAYVGNITASVPTYVGQSGFHALLVPTTAARQVCIVSTGTTVGIAGHVTYIQQ